MSIFRAIFLGGLSLALPVVSSVPVLAQQGVKLSARERQQAEPVTLPDGRRVLSVRNYGVPFLFGAGDVTGKASSEPSFGGQPTDSVLRSTASSGIVPGQEPE